MRNSAKRCQRVAGSIDLGAKSLRRSLHLKMMPRLVSRRKFKGHRVHDVPYQPLDVDGSAAHSLVHLPLVTNFLVAYVASHDLAPGADREMLFCTVGTVAFIDYAAALLQMSICYGRALSMTTKSTIDGLIYAAVTAGTF